MVKKCLKTKKQKKMPHYYPELTYARQYGHHPPDCAVDVLMRDHHVVQLPLVAGLQCTALDVRQQLGAHVHVHGPVPVALVQHVQRHVPVEFLKRRAEVGPHARLVHQVHQRSVGRPEVDAGRPYFRQPAGVPCVIF